jgi:hypothetical protein
MATGLPFDDVLSAAQAGAAWAFEVLYRDLAPSVTGYLRLHGAAEPDDQRSVLLLRILADLTIEQVAQAMGRSVGAVKALQRRGLRALRTRLETAPEKVGAGAYPSEPVRR